MMMNALANMMIEARKCRVEGKCPNCKKLVDLSSFMDEISKREYAISGLCQPCQDIAFADDEEEEV